MLTVIKQLLSADEVAQFRKHLDAAQWQDGLKTAGTLAKSVKQNQQLEETSELAISLGNHILRKLAVHDGFTTFALPSKIYPPRFNRYTGGGTYGMHVDRALMPVAGSPVTVRGDISATLFLSAPDEYEGGVLEIDAPTGHQSVKLPAGDMVLYPSGALHRVTPVTKGARIASFFWVESFVSDPGRRALLFDLDKAIQGVTPSLQADDPNLLKLTAVYHNLLRGWSRT
ncbi:MAG: Fe2+-dependent dioxygenase [Pseudomonadota bacterium]